MTIEAALYTHLSTYAGLTALVGTRIYPADIPQSAANTAAVTYHLISDTPVHSGIADLIVHSARFQFSCWGTTYLNACVVAAQIKAALQDYSGVMGGAGGVTVQRSFYEDTTDLYEDIGDNVKRVGRALDFIIWHQGG